MSHPLIECVPNLSEGRDPACIAAFLAALETVPDLTVLHQTSDPDHNRTVITYAGPPPAVLQGAIRLAVVAARTVDLRRAKGAHPRLGALDVLPFVPLEGSTLEDCIALAYRAGLQIWREAEVPVYFYEAAALVPERRKLEDVRRGEFESLRTEVLADVSKRPDIGGPALHPSAGAVIIGARKFLIAFNVNLRTTDLSVAQSIARAIRTSNGGLPAVKALGLSLPSRGLVQISMNLTDFEVTPIGAVFAAISELARRHRVAIEESELIGLAPSRALNAELAAAVQMRNFDSQRIIETRLKSTGSVGNV